MYNEKELKSIKLACGMVSKLVYTKNYSVDKFIVSKDPKNNIRIDFRIKRSEKFEDVYYTTYQKGQFYISKNGKMFFYNVLGNQKPLKTINQVAGIFEQNI